MKKIYVAGAYSSDNIIGVFDNIRRGIHTSYGLLNAGYAPFVPWFDWLFLLIGPVSLDKLREYTLVWMRGCEAVYVIPEGLENSKGTHHEIKVAESLGIPVYYDIEELFENE